MKSGILSAFVCMLLCLSSCHQEEAVRKADAARTAAASCNPTYQGKATYYGYGGGGNCSYPMPNSPVLIGAMNQQQYQNSQICGACVAVTGAKGTVQVRIEDRCPECPYGNIDLSQPAFAAIDDPIKGIVPITWKIVPCPLNGPVQFYFKEGSSQWWTAVQIRNHRYPVQKLEYKVNGSWVNMYRETYNYFVVPSGMGPGPYDFRITDLNGAVIQETGIPLRVTTPISGRNQFPVCGG